VKEKSRNKERKDYSQYFQSVYVPPNLKKQKRGKEQVEYQHDFELLLV
jgi:tRNA-2-methylthio-N6-dimethylallyladenosine synthase